MSAVAVHHAEAGRADAPVVVLAHSLGADLTTWEEQVEPLVEAGLRVVRYDGRGHGGSPVPEGPYDIADLGGDLVALLDLLGVERAHLVGISLGGMAVLWVAAHHPGRVARLVPACTTARFPDPAPWRERAAAVRAGGTAAVAEAVAQRWLPASQRTPDRLAALVAMIAGTPPEGYASCCGALERLDLRADLARIRAPTLVLGGREDEAIPPAHQEELAAAIDGARLELLDDAAHLANLARPDAFSALLTSFLTDPD